MPSSSAIILRELLHIVTQAARAELAEVGEVLAQLGGLDASDPGERLAGDGADGVVAEAREAAQINRETINRLAAMTGRSNFFKPRKIKGASGIWQELSREMLVSSKLFRLQAVFCIRSILNVVRKFIEIFDYGRFFCSRRWPDCKPVAPDSFSELTSRRTQPAPRWWNGAIRESFAVSRVEDIIPRWMKEQKVPGGWLTAKYSDAPLLTLDRKPRDVTKGKLDGRSSEIQRLIGRSDPRPPLTCKRSANATVWIDCDVLTGRRRDAYRGNYRRVCGAFPGGKAADGR